MQSLRDIRLFLKVIQMGSFSAAARATGLSPAAVSRRISMLEQGMGLRLMYRTSRKLTLTEVGQTFLENGADIVDRLDRLDGLIAEYQETPRGLLHVHARVSMGIRLPRCAPIMASTQTPRSGSASRLRRYPHSAVRTIGVTPRIFLLPKRRIPPPAARALAASGRDLPARNQSRGAPGPSPCAPLPPWRCALDLAPAIAMRHGRFVGESEGFAVVASAM